MGPTPVRASAGVEWGPGLRVSNKVPGDAATVSAHFENANSELASTIGGEIDHRGIAGAGEKLGH